MKRLFCSVASIRLPLVFMSDIVPTVTIMTAGGPVQINRDNYNEADHGAVFAGDHEYNADGTRRDANPVTPSAPGYTRGDEKIAPSTNGGAKVEVANLGVKPGKKGRKDIYTVIDVNTGEAVEMDGIDEHYSSNADAWKAITDAQAAAQTRDEVTGDKTSGDAITTGM